MNRTTNGRACYEWRRWTGRTGRIERDARITDKRVAIGKTYPDIFDRATGRFAGRRDRQRDQTMRLVWYEIDGQPRVVFETKGASDGPQTRE